MQQLHGAAAACWESFFSQSRPQSSPSHSCDAAWGLFPSSFHSKLHPVSATSSSPTKQSGTHEPHAATACADCKAKILDTALVCSGQFTSTDSKLLIIIVWILWVVGLMVNIDLRYLKCAVSLRLRCSWIEGLVYKGALKMLFCAILRPIAHCFDCLIYSHYCFCYAETCWDFTSAYLFVSLASCTTFNTQHPDCLCTLPLFSWTGLTLSLHPQSPIDTHSAHQTQKPDQSCHPSPNLHAFLLYPLFFPSPTSNHTCSDTEILALSCHQVMSQNGPIRTCNDLLLISFSVFYLLHLGWLTYAAKLSP